MSQKFDLGPSFVVVMKQFWKTFYSPLFMFHFIRMEPAHQFILN